MTDDTPAPTAAQIEELEGLLKTATPGPWEYLTGGARGYEEYLAVDRTPSGKPIPEPDLSKYDDGFHADLTQPSLPAFALLVADLSALIAQQAAVARGEGT